MSSKIYTYSQSRIFLILKQIEAGDYILSSEKEKIFLKSPLEIKIQKKEEVETLTISFFIKTKLYVKAISREIEHKANEDIIERLFFATREISEETYFYLSKNPHSLKKNQKNLERFMDLLRLILTQKH